MFGILKSTLELYLSERKNLSPGSRTARRIIVFHSLLYSILHRWGRRKSANRVFWFSVWVWLERRVKPLNIYKNISHRKKCQGINTLAVFMTSPIGNSYFVNKCSLGLGWSIWNVYKIVDQSIIKGVWFMLVLYLLCLTLGVLFIEASSSLTLTFWCYR